MKVIGCLVLILALAIIALLYHMATQVLWHDIFAEEYERRYEAEVERRWRSSRIRIHQTVRIVDEMNKEDFV